ncbi:putative glucose-6-phosphate isomerase [Candidatus Endolissoclinum faulkneri L5]|uniref:Glucose-6-phosphate isomerase n=1 Tax=Candidatus Endolissoclinum faulkneri L5 TaxID=1401328 RepID=V9TVG6_9PROT|nr:glucose-6-phosphate isomerase [Candidatus Endolissoclinum faulkneri]AHC73315.1 putative glucose-6-phosphate isomerase [Candidatus Endolissoclinum faulkneri L5]
MLQKLPIANDIDACFIHKVDGGFSPKKFKEMGELGSIALEFIRARFDDGSLPILTLPYRRDDIASWKPIVDRYHSLYKDVVVLGIGGSILGGATVCALVDGSLITSPRIHFLDNIDPITFDSRLSSFDMDKTGFLAISKSGSTTETLTKLLIVIDRLGNKNFSKQITCLTEPTDNPMRRIASTYGFFCLEYDPKVIGRFSALSTAGLLPAAIAGLNVERVRHGAAAVLDATISAKNPLENPAVAGAAINVALARNHGINQTVLMPYVERLERLSIWFRQLWAESLGKEGHGTTPVNALGAVDQHSQMQLYLAGPKDKFFTVICSDPRGLGGRVRAELAGSAAESLNYLVGHTMGDLMAAEQRATIDCLIRNSCPTRLISFSNLNEEVMGGLIMQFILETIAAAQIMGINAFDQPVVEENKLLIRQFLQEET